MRTENVIAYRFRHGIKQDLGSLPVEIPETVEDLVLLLTQKKISLSRICYMIKSDTSMLIRQNFYEKEKSS